MTKQLKTFSSARSTPPEPGFPGALAYSIPALVRVSGLSRATLYREIAAGRLMTRKCGKRTLVLAADLEAFLTALPEGGRDGR